LPTAENKESKSKDHKCPRTNLREFRHKNTFLCYTCPNQRSDRYHVTGLILPVRILELKLIGIIFLFFSAQIVGAKDIFGHGGPVVDIEVSNDRSKTFTASFDYSFIIWDSKKLKMLAKFDNHESSLVDVAIDGTDKNAVILERNNSISVWDISGIPLNIPSMQALKIKENYKVSAIAISNDAAFIATGGFNGQLSIWSTDTATKLFEINSHVGAVSKLSFTENDQHLLTAGTDGKLIKWSTPTLEIEDIIINLNWGIRSFDHNNSLISIGTSDGKMLVVDSNDKKTIFEHIELNQPVTATSISHTANIVSFGNINGRILTYDIILGTIISDNKVVNGPIWSMKFLDNKQIVYGGLDDFISVVPINNQKWNFTTILQNTREFQTANNTRTHVGEIHFKRKCSVCHSIDLNHNNKAGPTLHKIMGRKAGSLNDYNYSDALKNANFIWDTVTIRELFEQGPDEFIPGSKMPLQVISQSDDLNALLYYLEKLSGEHVITDK